MNRVFSFGLPVGNERAEGFGLAVNIFRTEGDFGQRRLRECSALIDLLFEAVDFLLAWLLWFGFRKDG